MKLSGKILLIILINTIVYSISAKAITNMVLESENEMYRITGDSGKYSLQKGNEKIKALTDYNYIGYTHVKGQFWYSRTEFNYDNPEIQNYSSGIMNLSNNGEITEDAWFSGKLVDNTVSESKRFTWLFIRGSGTYYSSTGDRTFLGPFDYKKGSLDDYKQSFYGMKPLSEPEPLRAPRDQEAYMILLDNNNMNIIKIVRLNTFGIHFSHMKPSQEQDDGLTIILDSYRGTKEDYTPTEIFTFKFSILFLSSENESITEVPKKWK